MPKSSTVEQELQSLRLAYQAKLPKEIRHIRSLWDNLLYVKWNRDVFELMCRLVHNMAGASGTFGLREVGSLAGKIDQQLKQLADATTPPDDGERTQISGGLQRLDELIEFAKNLEVLEVGTNLVEPVSTSNAAQVQVLVLEDDGDQAAVMKMYLEHHGCQVKCVENEEQLHQALSDQSYEILLADIMLPGHPTGGIEVVNRAKQSLSHDPCVLFMSARGDLEARLSAVRAGGAGYFLKPIDMAALTAKIDYLKDTLYTEYRVLIVEDDASCASFETTVLQGAGFSTRVVDNPLQILQVLEEYRPDIILMDLYLPQCNGGELAQVIRQEQRFADLPILFVSSETDTEKQNLAITQGGDAFLNKPLSNRQLVDAVAGRVRRARWLTRRLQYLNEQDHQTGLINQYALIARLETAINEFSGADISAALLFIEIDRFKSIRDQIGLGAAELLVTHTAGIVRNELGSDEAVARLGDASLVVLMPGVSPATGFDISKRLRKTISDQMFKAGTHSLSVTVSIGVAPLCEQYEHGDQWLSGAAIACDIACNAGENMSYLHHPKTDAQAEKEQYNRCAKLLHTALETDALHCLYQPIASLHGELVEKYDVLLRMNDQQGRELLPAQFLPVAEQEGVSREMDRWVTHHAIRVLEERHRMGMQTEFFIKLSEASFLDSTFCDWLAQQLASFGLPASALVFELSERSVSQRVEAAGKLCEKLHGMGCGIAIEHFGVHRGSSQLLNHVTVDYLKIDGSFADDLAYNITNQNNIRELLAIAAKNDAKVIASFVEDAASLGVLWQCGVAFIQGNFLQEPSSLMNFSFSEELA